MVLDHRRGQVASMNTAPLRPSPSAHARGAQDIVVAYVNFVEFFEVLLKLHRKAFKFHNE